MRTIIVTSAIFTSGIAMACLAVPASAQRYAAPTQYYAAPPAYAQQPAYGYATPTMPPAYDRDDWIKECRANLRERRRRGETGGVVGGLVGGTGGAILGDALSEDGSRLAGSLIGGGIGGIAGVAIGTAIGLMGRDEEKRDCKAWLQHYERASAAQSASGYGQQYNDGYGGRVDGYSSDGYAYEGRYPRGNEYSYGYSQAPAYGGNYGYSQGYSQGGGYAYGQGGYTTTTQSGGVVVVVEEAHGERYIPVIVEEIIEEVYEVQETEIIRERVIDYVPVEYHPQPAPRAQPTKRIRYSKQR